MRDRGASRRLARRLLVGETVGVVCVVIAVWQIYDPWRALGAFGFGLFTVCQFIDRRMNDDPIVIGSTGVGGAGSGGGGASG